MNAKQRARALAALAAMTAGVAFGQTYVAPTAVTTPSGAVVRTAPPADLNTWASDYSVRHNGRISRQAYLDEMARRWDAADINQQGLTPADLSNLTGRVDTNAPVPLSGSGVQAGNMGPGNSKGK
jgi:hypothetical protein